MEQLMTPTDTPTEPSNNTEIIDVPCEDCPPTFSIDQLAEMFPDEHMMLAAILAELIMVRTSITELSGGLSEIGNIGIGSMFKGLFGSGSGT